MRPISLVKLFFLMILLIVPKHGPINGSQYLTITMFACSALILFPDWYQLSGLTELMHWMILRSFGGSLSEYWVLPGKRKLGYCKEKVYIITSCPSLINCLANLSLNVAKPPLSGNAGPMMMILLNCWVMFKLKYNTKVSLYIIVLLIWREILVLIMIWIWNVWAPTVVPKIKNATMT